MNEKELLEIFDDGLDCLGQRRHIDYDTEKQIKELLKNKQIKILIIK